MSVQKHQRRLEFYQQLVELEKFCEEARGSNIQDIPQSHCGVSAEPTYLDLDFLKHAKKSLRKLRI